MTPMALIPDTALTMTFRIEGPPDALDLAAPTIRAAFAEHVCMRGRFELGLEVLDSSVLAQAVTVLGAVACHVRCGG